MFKKITKLNIDFVTNRPKLVILIALILTLIAGLLASTLQMELNWVALAPKNDKAVEEYQEILENFPTLDNMIMIVESDDERLLESIVTDATTKLMENQEYVKNVTAGIDRDFMVDYGMLYMEPEDIEMMSYMLLDSNLHGFYQMLAMMLGELQVAYDMGMIDEVLYENQLMIFNNVPGIIDLSIDAVDGKDIDALDVETVLEQIFAGNTLITSDNGKMAMISIMPNFDMMDINKLEPGVEYVESIVKDLNNEYENAVINVTGMHVVARDETASIASDSQLTTVLSFILILMILYFAFRSLIAPVLAFVPLIVGIIWSMGLSAAFIGRLNMMTAFSAAMLLGLGIDYAIHLYSGYTEKRSKGYDKRESIELAIEVSGPGIVTGALTTAVAFFALNISKLALLSELGTVMGLGIVTTLLAVFWVLPALIMLKREKEEKVAKIKGEFKWIGSVSYSVSRHKSVVVVIMLLLTVFMGYQATKVEFDTNLMNLEPEGLKSIEIMNYLVEEYNMSADSFNIQVDNLDEVYELQEKLSKINGVHEVTSVASVLPTEEVQKERLEAIDNLKPMLAYKAEYLILDNASMKDIATQLSQELTTTIQTISKLEMRDSTRRQLQEVVDSLDRFTSGLDQGKENVLDSFLENFYIEYSAMGNRMMVEEPLLVGDLPRAFKDQFVSANESKFMVTVVPDFDIWSNLDSEKGIKFFNDVRAVDESVTGTPIFMKVLYDSVSEELALTGSVLFLILLTILFIHFRSVKYTLLALLPLVFTLLFMVGTMVLIKLPFNMLNFLSILLVIGIGIDDGVHILHHYKQGETRLKDLFSSVGRAISLTTMTTVFGFGSLIFSSYRGVATLGKALAIGVTYAFIMTVVILPIFLKNKEIEQ